MKKLISILLAAAVMLSLTSCFPVGLFGLMLAVQPSNTPAEVVELYEEHKETFWQAAEICKKHDIRHPVLNWKLRDGKRDKEAEKIRSLSSEERDVLKKCIDFGCHSIDYMYWEEDYLDKEEYVNFLIPFNDSGYQGIYCFTETAPVDFGAFLQDQMRYERELVYQKLDENAYYYSASGGKPTEDDPVTIKDHIEEDSE